jgi:1-phosphofructokinase family hexose kinase
MILTVTLNPSVDRTLFVEGLRQHDSNRVLRCETDAGGKGVNASRMAARLGHGTCATGFLAGGTGAYVRRRLDDEGVQHEFVEVSGETRSNVSVEDGSGEPPTTFNERGAPVDGLDFEQLAEVLARRAAGARWAVLAGSLPPGSAPETYATIGSLLRSAALGLSRSGGRAIAAFMGSPSASIDADGEPMKAAMALPPDLLKPNAAEASRLLGRAVDTPEDAVAAARTLSDQMVSAGSQVAVAAVSMGADGAALASPGGAWWGEAVPVEARSTIGSGDSMVAGIVGALANGGTPEEALRWGLAAGAATALSDGADIGRREDALRLFESARVWPR